MRGRSQDRVMKIIDAYFNLPWNKYADIIAEVRMRGGLTAVEVQSLKDRLLFIHSDTIIRQAGLYD